MASEVLAAAIGGAVSTGVLYPLETVKTRMQASQKEGHQQEENNDNHQQPNNMITTARSIYDKEGVCSFFRGVEVSALQSALEKALYFAAYTSLKKGHAALTGNAQLGTVVNLVLGYVAEWMHLPLSLPVDAWTTRIQTSKEAPVKILLNMLSERKSLYKGMSAYYVLCLKPALQYTVYEQVKSVMLAGRRRLSAVEAFVLGMAARAVATVVVFPFLRAKVLLQIKRAENSEATPGNGSTKTSSIDILQQLWKDEGITGLYQGLGPELTRGVLSSALLLMIKERIAAAVQPSKMGTSKR